MKGMARTEYDYQYNKMGYLLHKVTAQATWGEYSCC